jgi:hypothetical protein
VSFTCAVSLVAVILMRRSLAPSAETSELAGPAIPAA